MDQYAEMDADMRELVAALARAIVPRRERKAAVWRTNLHSPYYSPNRYKRIV
jgi:hypothetical protein